MSAASCPRAFEAEAIRDGRLTGVARASFERHALGCAACSREIEALGAVAAAVRSTPYASADELHVRRERTRLLAAFDHELVAPARAPAARRRTLWAAAALAVSATLVVWNVRRHDDPARRLEAAHATIRAEGAATWSDRLENGREVVRIESGVLSIHVDHARNTHRLLVLLPDGELEDTGTTFTVQVEQARTTRVSVQEGSVLLRLEGRSPVAVEGGAVWTQTAPESPSSASAAAASASVAAASDPPPGVRPVLEARNRQPRTTAPMTKDPPSDASVDFQSAVATLHRGDDREASDAFARFLMNHSHDRRAEDAAYLRVIALQRCGDERATREAATAYLRRYPTGFRRAEVEALSR